MCDYPIMSIKYDRVRNTARNGKTGGPPANWQLGTDVYDWMAGISETGGKTTLRVEISEFHAIETTSVCSFSNRFCRQIGRSICLGRMLGLYPQHRDAVVASLAKLGMRPDPKFVQAAYHATVTGSQFAFPEEEKVTIEIELPPRLVHELKNA